jgi:lysophospholipase L1-like esterase
MRSFGERASRKRRVLSSTCLTSAVAAGAAIFIFCVPFACSSSSSDGTGTSSSSGGDAPAPEPGAPASPVAPAPSAPPGTPEVLFVGRFETTDPAGPKAAWPGARILTRFDGTTVSVKFAEFKEDYMEGAPSRWDVQIDDGAPEILIMNADGQPRDFEIASNLPKGPHKVELYKRSETQNGVTQFLGFDFHGGAALPPPAAQKRHIEVIGDSASSGFGIETLNAPNWDCEGPDHGAMHQNFRKAWGALLGVMFDAEVHGIMFSGKGIARNIWRSDTDALINYYNRSNPDPALQQNPPLFDLQSWIPDAVVLMMGGNDLAPGVSEPNPGPLSRGEFYGVYRDFVVHQLRARSPNTHLFLVVPGLLGRDILIDTVHGVAAERNGMGDARVYPVVPTPYVDEEMTGCNGHGNPEYHQRIARELAAVIREKTGWQ